MSQRRGESISEPPPESTGGGSDGGGATNIWGILSDLIGAGASVASSLISKPGQEQDRVVFVPQSGIDAGILKIAVFVIVGIIIFRLVKR